MSITTHSTQFFTADRKVNNAVFDKLVTQIAEYLDWEVTQPKTKEGYYYNCYRTIRDRTGKYLIELKLDSHQKNKQTPKLEVYWNLREIIKNYPHKTGDYLINNFPSDRRNETEIKVTATRDPKQLAKDIERRLIKPVQGLVDQAIEIHLKWYQSKVRTENLAKDLAKVVNTKPQNDHPETFYKSLNRGNSGNSSKKHISIKGSVHSDDSINLTIKGLSSSVTRQVLELLASESF